MAMPRVTRFVVRDGTPLAIDFFQRKDGSLQLANPTQDEHHFNYRRIIYPRNPFQRDQFVYDTPAEAVHAAIDRTQQAIADLELRLANQRAILTKLEALA